MKKVVFASMLVAASMVSVVAPYAIAQDQGSQSSQITIKDPAEYNAYTNAIGQSTPAAKAAAIEDFLQQYPNSVVKQEMLEQLVGAYTAANDQAKTYDAVRRLLQVDPNNLRALTLAVYMEKSQANGDAAKLDDAAANAQKGLAATKPQAMSQADFDKLKAAATPIFYNAISADDLAKKDYKDAISALTSELKADQPDQTTKQPSLADTYYLGTAYVQEDPKDIVNGIWFLARAAQYLPDPYKTTAEKAAEYWYNKYHGGMDGFDQVKTLVTQSVLPPDSYNPTPAPPPPSPADQAAKVVASTPDLKTLNLNDKEFILFNGKPEDAGKMWDTMKGQTYQIPGKVVSATASSVQLAVTEDAKASNTADFTINMKKPLDTPPAIGTDVNYDATFDSYTQNPKMITLINGIPPAPEKPAHHAPTHRRAAH